MKSLDESLHWMPKSVSLQRKIANDIKYDEVVMICIKNKVDELVIPHPITDFIRKVYRNRGVGYHTQLKAARVICKFLNFIYRSIGDDTKGYNELLNQGIRGLKLKHGGDFITQLTYEGVSFKHSSYCESVLTKFYIYLKENELIDEIFQVIYRKDGEKVGVPYSLFSKSVFDIERPNKKWINEKLRLKDFGPNRYRLAYEFIEEAESSDIALGVCFQILAGLRLGEVVNLTKSSIYETGFRGNDGMWLIIQDNQEELFGHLSSKYDVQVKRPREVFVLNDQRLWEIYHNHMERLKKLEKEWEYKNNNALFISNNGLPLSGAGYAKRFHRVKKRFLEKLRINRRYEDLEFLTSLPWSTHIGRGIFTNFLIDIGLSIEEIANLRGDKTLTATLEYIEKRTSYNRIKEHVNILTSVYGGNKDNVDILKSSSNTRKIYDRYIHNWSGLK
ncbi:site-specific integrase [Bacillus toyonensis]|uniref:site-specific integrase n=1 Tax=Bacillus toyonensis TaxID=155322 RepID=UPI0021D160C3|nr:site-specific integrase [Bacillus toyonensis]MCU4769475.1 site-specific integrase [Bacillus toyonensis]